MFLGRVERPGRRVAIPTSLLLVSAWGASVLALWLVSPRSTLPSPRDVWIALGALWWEGGLGPELFTTLRSILTALACAVVLSLGLAWASRVRFLAPLTAGVSKLRFLGLTGLVFPFTLLAGGGFALKVALLTFGMTTFLVTALARIVAEVPRADLDHVRSLGASEGRVFWECFVRGPLDRIIDAIRQNVAMGWSMITMVEGIARAEGGVGALLLNQNKHFKLAEVYALLAVVLLVGIVLDRALAWFGARMCPHTCAIHDVGESNRKERGEAP